MAIIGILLVEHILMPDFSFKLCVVDELGKVRPHRKYLAVPKPESSFTAKTNKKRYPLQGYLMYILH